jgi:hypothetical protein
MRIVMVEPHDVIAIPGFELRTFQCVGCGDVEKRMCFDSAHAHRTVALVPEAVEVPAPALRRRPEAANAPISNDAPISNGAPVSNSAPASNSRVKAILGGLVRLRGNKSVNRPPCA